MDATLIDAGTSPAEPLPAEALARLRNLLLEELPVQTGQAEEQGRAVTELRNDPDTAVGQFEVDWELAEVMVGWSEEAVEDIKHALVRLEDGSYGRCEQCSLPIPLERLESIPHARFCVSCQARRDAMR